MTVPVAVGTPITYKSLQITLLDVSEHDLIWTGDEMAYYPKAGSHVVDLVLSIHRGLSVSPVRVAWKSISTHQTDGLGWYTNFGGMSDSDDLPKIRTLTPEQDIDLAAVHTLRLAFFIPEKPQKLKLYVGDPWLILFDNPRRENGMVRVAADRAYGYWSSTRPSVASNINDWFAGNWHVRLVDRARFAFWFMTDMVMVAPIYLIIGRLQDSSHNKACYAGKEEYMTLHYVVGLTRSSPAYVCN